MGESGMGMGEVGERSKKEELYVHIQLIYFIV